MSEILNVWYSPCGYVKATCKGCENKLVKGEQILSVAKTRGRFSYVSKYCVKCAETELAEAFNQVSELMQRIIDTQEKINNEGVIKSNEVVT